MSRTYRRKGKEPSWLLGNYERIPGFLSWIYVYLPKESREGKKRINKYHSDAQEYPHTGRCHGPSWFINQYIQRPYRRACNQALKTLNDLDSIQILSKPKRIYWD